MAPLVKSAFLVLVLLVLAVGAQDETKYFEIGGTLVLDPKVSVPITSLTWKHGNNIVAEWIKGSAPLEYLGDFKDRSEVDLTTGILTIRGIRKAEEGEFKVEINSRERPGKFNAVGLRNLKGVPVVVAVRPLTCSSTSENCSLDCRGDFTDAGPLRFLWKKGETGPWEERKERNLTIINNEETKKIESFRCKAKNPLGETEESEAEKNPLNQEASDGGSGGAIAAGIIGGFLVVAGVGFGGYKYYNHKKRQGGNEGQLEMGPGDNHHPGGQNKGQTGPVSPERNSVDAQNPEERHPLTGPNATGNSENEPEHEKPNTVYSAVGSFNPGEADQSEVPKASENSENEPEHENGPTPNNDS